MTSWDTDLSDLTPETFIPDRTRLILDAASRLAGFDPAGAELLRHHTNAVYLLTSTPVVVKISRPGERHGTDVVSLVQWLETQKVPTVALVDVEQPLQLAGCAVTYWQYLPQEDSIVHAADIADPLRKLHLLHNRPPIPLSGTHLPDAIGTIARSIVASAILSPENKDYLSAQQHELAEQLTDVTFGLVPGLIHGDAHHRNTLWDNNHLRGVLCDWENAAIGQPEWDLVTLEVHCRRFEHPANEYQEFVKRYGLDVRDWSGYQWLKDLRELRMITTNARKSVPGSANAQEVLRRVGALREGLPIGWRIM